MTERHSAAVTGRRTADRRSSRAMTALVLAIGLVLGVVAGAIAFVLGPAGTASSAPGPAESSVAASPTPSPTPDPVELPADCTAWLDSVDAPGDGETTIAPADAEPLRRLQAPADGALEAADDALRCDLASPEQDATATEATFSVVPLGLDDARALRTELLEAGADCGPVAGGVLCIAVMPFDVDDPVTYGRTDTHFFRDGVWIAGAVRAGELVPRENLFRDVVASIFPDQP